MPRTRAASSHLLPLSRIRGSPRPLSVSVVMSFYLPESGAKSND